MFQASLPRRGDAVDNAPRNSCLPFDVVAKRLEDHPVRHRRRFSKFEHVQIDKDIDIIKLGK